ncbi:MAG TPA: rhamnogalacturonan acetylesterase [Segetibacter sp.]|nr:rhamnogalacturonan acetylesterase [Segetibacter sp.]
MEDVKSIKIVAFAFFILCTSFIIPAKKKIKIWMIGDSTMCTYEPSRGPITGWGMPFANFFDSWVSIDNRARGGRSTRTFLGENRWQPIADSIQDGDYVLIQFGHNDEAKEPQYAARYTPVPDYKNNLTKFITETRAKRGIPILITPVTRMKFDSTGKALETHAEYTNAVFEVAKKLHTPVIDLDKMSRQLLQKMGPETARFLFMQYEPGQEPLFPEGQKDNTHFNEYGARRMAELVLAEIKNQKLGLADRVVVRQSK